jgi:GT2 family glycosyltransferase/glycosyltransferase involved in cell wall biosynthesis/predicted  nucleic acid-binding Zn-ribbon protein
MQKNPQKPDLVQDATVIETPLVSVLVRSMDRPSLLSALESVAAQTWQNLEVVAVNATGLAHSELPERIGTVPIRLVDTGAPLRRSQAANAGLETARGDYLCFLDDDDLFMPEHIESLLSALGGQPDFKAAYSGVRVEVYGPDGTSGSPERTFDFNQDYSREALWGRNYIPMHAMLFMRDLIRDRGCRFDESFDLFEDWDFWLQLSQYTDFLHVDRVSAIYRNTGASGLADEQSSAYEAQKVKQGMAAVLEKWSRKRSALDWADMIMVRDQRWEHAEQDWLASQQALKSTIGLLEAQDRAKQSAIDVLELETATRKTAIDDLERETVAKQRAIDDLERETVAKQQAIDDLERETVAKQQAIDDLERETVAKQQAIDNLERETAAKQQAIDVLERETVAKQRAIDDLELQNRERQTAIDALEQRHVAMFTAIQSLEADVDQLTQRVAEQSHELSAYRVQAAEQQGVVQHQVYELNRLRDENRWLSSDLEWHRNCHEAMRQSTSWKVTMPLRLVSYVLQGRSGEVVAVWKRRKGYTSPEIMADEKAEVSWIATADGSPVAPEFIVEEPYATWMALNRPRGNRLLALGTALGEPLFPRRAPGRESLAAPWVSANDEETGGSDLKGLDDCIQARFYKTPQTYPNASRFRGSPYLLGYAALGPVLLGFTHWLIKRHRKDPVSGFAFLSRDGYFLKAAYDIVAGHLPDLPPSHYVAGSRVLCSLSTMDSLERILQVGDIDHHPMPVRQFLCSRFGFEEGALSGEIRDVLSAVGFASEMAVLEQDDPRKPELLRALAPQIFKLAAEAARTYRAYLERQNLDWPNAPIVDIGYSGTAQAAISRLLGVKTQGRYLLTNCRATRLDEESLAYASWLDHQVELSHPFFHHVQLWELFLSATHGSINRIEPESLTPVEEPEVLDAYTRRILAVLHRGALDFVSDFMGTHGETFSDMTLPAKECAQALTRYFETPEPDDCVFLSKIVFEDRYGGDIRPLMVLPGATDFAESLATGSVWPAASLALKGAEPVTPFWSGIADDDGSTAETGFMDRQQSGDIQPACFAREYQAAFDEHGFPKSRHTASQVRIVIPVIGEIQDRVTESLAGQMLRGFSIDWVRIGTGAATPSAFADDIVSETHQANDLADLMAIACRPGAEWVLLTDGETVLEPTAIAEWLAAAAEADAVIGDEDVIDAQGERGNPHFKPECSPELLASTDYFGGAWLVNRQRLAGLKPESTEIRACLWELAIKLVHAQARVARVPRVLSHRPPLTDADRLARARAEANRFVEWHLREWGSSCRVITPAWSLAAGRLACEPVFPDEGPEVAIIIPTKNQGAVVRRCLNSLELTTYANYRIYLIDNDSDDAESLAYFANLPPDRVTVLKIGNQPAQGFSYSRINNLAVAQTQDEPYLLFLNNDTEVIEPRWLSQMVGWQQLPDVGSVGALLYFGNERIQHAGITHKLLMNVLPAPSLKWVHRDETSYQDYAHLARDSAAQTAACLLTPRATFLAHGEFDAVDFNIAYNDCDYGFKLNQAGLRNVYCPNAVLYHHEGLTRGTGKGNDRPSEEAAFVQKYARWDDPYYSPNLAIGRTDFAIRPGSPVTVPMPALRLAVATHNLNYEGAPLVLFEIVQGLLQQGIAEVLVLSLQEGLLRKKFEDLGCRVLVVPEPMRLFGDGPACAEAMAWVARQLASARIDVVLGNTILCWWAVEAAESTRRPSLWIIHESEAPLSHLAEHGEALALRGRKALAMAYRIVFVSGATREVFQGLECRGNFHTVYNGFDRAAYDRRIQGKSREVIRRLHGLHDDQIMVLVPGAVCARKSQIDVVQAIPLLPPEVREQLRLFIVGDRPDIYSTEMHRAIAGLDPDCRAVIRVLPHSQHVEDYFLAADILVNAAKVEAFPKIIQEGMYFRLPMVVTPVYGVNEQVTDEVSALFFNVGDSAKLGEQLARLVRDKALRERLSANSYDSLGRFPDVHAMCEEYGRLIKQAWLSA